MPILGVGFAGPNMTKIFVGAIRTFFSSGMDALVIGSYLVEK